MGLYLVVFDGSKEIGGVDVGHYSDFAAFRNTVFDRLETNGRGTRFSTLMLHSDSRGEWTPQESRELVLELQQIVADFKQLPPSQLVGWQQKVANARGIKPANLYECFFDPAGRPLLERLISLARLSAERQLPILFQ